MKVVITGGLGFLGQLLARRVLTEGVCKGDSPVAQRVDELVLVDILDIPFSVDDKRVRIVRKPIADALVESTLLADADTIVHLAAVVSGAAEADFDLGMHVNLDETRLLLDACRKLARPPRVVFSSSLAVFGGTLPETVTDAITPTPQNSYGAQKFIGEILVADYSRKGFIDGRSIRLPTVTVRPGKPNKAASSFASGIIREPLKGEIAVCPVPGEIRMWVTSPAMAVEALYRACNMSASTWGARTAVNLSGLCVSVDEMANALRTVAGQDVYDLIRWQVDPTIERIVRTWPGNFDTRRAREMGFRAPESFETIVREYVDSPR